MAKKNEEFFSVLNVPEGRLNIDGFSTAENRPIGRNKNQNYRSQGFSRGRSRNSRSSNKPNDINPNWRNRPERDSSRNSSKKPEHGWRNRNVRDTNSRNDNTRISQRYDDDENDSSGAESTVSRSSTFSVQSYTRSSSRHRTSSNRTERPKWCDKNPKNNEKSVEFQFNKGNESTRTGRPYERPYKNDSTRSEGNYKRDRRTEYSHSERLNERDDRSRYSRSERPYERNDKNGNGDSERPNERDDRNESSSGHPDRPNRRDDRNETNRPERPNRELFIGYKYLKGLSEKEPHEMICEILRPNANIDVVLNRKDLQPDWIMLIMEIVRKLCESDFKSNRGQVLRYFCESPLLDHISHYLGEVALEKSRRTIENLNSFIFDLVVFYSAVIKTIPTVAVDKNFEKFLTKTKLGIDQMRNYLHKETDVKVVEELENLEKMLADETNIREKKIEKPRRRYIDIVEDIPPPEDFRELSLYPTEEDLNRHDFGFVRPNKIKGAYENVNHYLDVQFRLIREDFIDPLRRGLRNYKDAIALKGKPKYKYESVRLYPNSRIENIEVTKENQVAYVVNFNVNGRLKIKWEYSKRFMFGSLLLFTRDNFDTFFFGTVFNRDLEKLKKGHILVALIGSEPLEPEMFKQPFVMAESEVYFEPYCLVMKALKEYNESDFPMKKFIVDGNTTVDFPQYVTRLEYFYIYDIPVALNRGIGWPNPSVIGFDQHQFNAFRTALTSNFTVIQGPPGTGKTYLGLKIVEVLLDNIKLIPNVFRTPILLVCYTNHALDQFLEGILKFTRKIVRVGGQSKSEVLKPFNLRGRENLNILRREARKLVPAMNLCRNDMRKILLQLKKKTEEKKIIETPQGILSYRTLNDVMKPEFKRIMNDDESVVLWLLDTNQDPSNAGTETNPREKVARNVNPDPTEPIEIDEEIYIEEEDEMMEADVLVNEDDIFDPQEVNQEDMSVKYCISLDDLENLYMKTQRCLEELKRNESKFDDYTEFHNNKYQLKDMLRVIKLQGLILNHYLEKPDLDSSARYNTRDVNLWDLPLDIRWSIYWNWVSQLKQKFERELKDLETDYRSKNLQYEELKQLEDFHVVKNSLVVGMTTTCAARLQLLLKTLSPAVVIVEEAAEVLEAHIVVSLSKKCEHVILIGDHKQLKPSTAVYELSKKYNINVSLFERMINNNMYCPQLQIQHRMRPEISSLIVPSIYRELKDHESVREYPSVGGITKNLFFVEHNIYEENVEDSSSRKNKFEAEFMIQLCRYILLQGYTAEQITILTTYTGQMFHLREMKRDHAIMKNVKVIVVDKYQGEENDIILLSLVRSNQERKIGFLSIENRVCVALSRAKIGLYIIGNMDILSDSSLWKTIKEELLRQEAIGPKLTLYCEKHDVHTKVSCKWDFDKVLEGGCNNFCHEIMDCGHKCQLLCHKIDMEHKEKKCREKCLKKCIENHPCKKYCYEDCGRCTESVERSLPCGHKVTLQCFKDYLIHECQVEVSVVLQPCSHEVKKKCFQPLESVKCTFPCEDRLECGHQCVYNCHQTDDPDHLEYKCKKPCEKINRGCSKQHKCEKLCFEDCGKCKVRVDFPLKCGHNINLQCSANLDRANCYTPCARKCTDCKANCPKKCFEDCKPCKNKVTKIIPDCGHKIKIECSIVPERKLCVAKCQRNAPCGHKCQSLCGKVCGTERCLEMVKSLHVQALCGHGLATVPCWRRNEATDAEELLQYCNEPCNEMLKCGDPCTGTCGSCWQGRLHKTCEQKCGNVLVCGHSCAFPCRKVCPPCTRKCQYACKHSRCSKTCGVPCVHCNEKCEWKCEHLKCKRKCGDICERPPCYEPCKKKLKCSHDCIGFCGEPCPPKCRICDEDEVTMIVFGNEDEPDARFVLLEDCGHVIESQAMDQFIDMAAEKGEILMKLCPLCKTPIAKTLRYMNQVKKVYRDIQNVKKKIYGDEKEMKQLRVDLTEKLRNLDLKDEQLFGKELHLIPQTVFKYKEKLKQLGQQSHLSKQALRAMHFFTDMFSSIISRLDDLKKCHGTEKLRALKRLEFILKRVNPEALLINVQQVDETQKELNRYHRIVDYGAFLIRPEYSYNRTLPNVIRIDANITDILFGLKCFDNEQDTRIGRLFETLQKELKTSQTVSQEEKRMINAAMATSFMGGINSQGHWFKCTKGHIYCITECGGAMQESNCPECGEIIGGRNHQYVQTAQLASDMDGATRPAWSTGGDMRNFQFD